MRQELSARHAEFLVGDHDPTTPEPVGAYTPLENYSLMGATKGPQASIMERIRLGESVAQCTGSGVHIERERRRRR